MNTGLCRILNIAIEDEETASSRFYPRLMKELREIDHITAVTDIIIDEKRHLENLKMIKESLCK